MAVRYTVVLEAWCSGCVLFTEAATDDAVAHVRAIATQDGGKAPNTARLQLARLLAAYAKHGLVAIVDSHDRRQEFMEAALCIAAQAPELLPGTGTIQ